MPFEQVQENIQAFLMALKASSTTEDDFGNKKIRSEHLPLFLFFSFSAPTQLSCLLSSCPTEKVLDVAYVKSTFGPCFQLKVSQFKIEKS